MDIRNSPTGVPYLTEESADSKAAARRQPMSPLMRICLFAISFAVLQGLWMMASDTAVERLVVDQATVQVAATWVRMLTPDVPVVAVGPRLTAPGGGITVLKGCEGTDVLFLLMAAFSVAGLSWRRSVAGLVVGALIVYLLNQARIVALFYAFRQDSDLFDQLHGTLGPLAMVLLVGLYYYFWLNRNAQRPDDDHAGQAA